MLSATLSPLDLGDVLLGNVESVGDDDLGKVEPAAQLPERRCPAGKALLRRAILLFPLT
jgi:hypothetical protein